MRISDIINNISTKKVPFLNTDSPINQAVKLFDDPDISVIPILNTAGQVVGIIERDSFFKKISEKNQLETNRVGDKVRDFMETEFLCVNDNWSVYDILNAFLKWKKYMIYINSDGIPSMIINEDDLLSIALHSINHIYEEFSLVINSAYSGIVAINEKGTIRIFNKAAERILGKTSDEVIGKNILNVVPNTRLLDVIKTGKPEINQKFYYENKILITNRTPIMRGGKPVGAVAVFQDITDLEKLMEELGTTKRYLSTLQTILDTSFYGIAVVNRDGIITMVNRATEEFLGMDRSEMIGKHVTEVIENTRLHIVAKTGKPEVGWVQRVKGRDIIAERIPIIEDGQVVGAIGKIIFKDISELEALMKQVELLENKVAYYEKELDAVRSVKYSFSSIIGKSNQIQELKKLALKYARTDANILLIGESGTGKDLFAQAIHNASPRCGNKFIHVNCAAIPRELLESELFGYEKGAFTGALKEGKPGKFELANGGTIFLDEIGDMPLEMQAKLLKVIETKEVERVGSTKSIKVDIRIISATNKDVRRLIEEGRFREDLFYRLNVISLLLPPLRERREDIDPLIDHFLREICEKYGKNLIEIDEKVRNIFMKYHWPGNVRELMNVLERMIISTDKKILTTEDVPNYIRNELTDERQEKVAGLSEAIAEAEKKTIIMALRAVNGNRVKAAKLLGIPRSTLYAKLKKYNIGNKRVSNL